MRVLLIFILCLKIDCNELNVTNTKMNIKCENPRDCDSDYSECIKGFCHCKENYKVKKFGDSGPHCKDISGCGPNQNCFENICQYRDICKEIDPTFTTQMGTTQKFSTVGPTLTNTKMNIKCSNSRDCDSDYSECREGFCYCKENYKVEKVGDGGPHCKDTSGCGPNQNCFENICQYRDICKEIDPTFTIHKETSP
jgi:hypothetical protein